MSADNHVTLMGRLVEDPQLQHTQSGKSVAHFRLAWSRKFGDSEKRLFLDGVAWEKLGETICNYLKKGSPALFEGELETVEWSNQEGQHRSKIQLLVTGLRFLPGTNGNGNGNGEAEVAAAPPSVDTPPFARFVPSESEEVPF